MGHTPYGYRIEEGKVVVDEENASKVIEFFNAYISGLALTVAAENVGLKMCHASAGKMLRNKRYLGDDYDYYPAIIDQEIFDKAEKMRVGKARTLGRVRELVEDPKPEYSIKFTIPKVEQKYTDPFKQAEYAYSMIGSEVINVNL
ncbi:recombinase [Clostridium botulinum]|uniref:hypothetical protein n=1 Tax=Clostridium botulinum TaxID=1491 RepID=UPI0007745AD2|nr:hypothetical protein [Clostridium botulinum]MBN1048280.1 recombinase [Clostridium botulinum]NFE85572.1 recombinase [Clostridium botulinum]NFG36293.1 recombinase [Clostridium botulinum]NFN27733.1 recombinase [Clostridium botulinum]NFO02176.1 recombinase [Clostridium botulinum]